MSLTGVPLLVFSVLLTLAAAGATVFFWPIGRRWRSLTRTGCVLLTEFLALFTIGLVINRAEDDLYPSWSALFDRVTSGAPPAGDHYSGALDDYLRGRAAEGRTSGVVIDWRPTGWQSWHLAGAPEVFVPPAYFARTDQRFPVVVVVGPAKDGAAQGGWDPRNIKTFGGTANAVLVFLRVDKPDDGDLLGAAVPGRLAADLRVSEHGWAAVGVGTDAGPALDALSTQPGRYRAAALVSDGTGMIGPGTFSGRHFNATQPVLVVAGGITASPDTGRSAQSVTASGGKVQVVTRPDYRVPIALDYLVPLLPAPLAAAAPAGTVVVSPTPTAHPASTR
jgi:hypothetical protein